MHARGGQVGMSGCLSGGNECPRWRVRRLLTGRRSQQPGRLYTQPVQPRHIAFVHPGERRDPQNGLLEVVGPVERAGLLGGVHDNQSDVGGTASVQRVVEGRSGAVLRRWLVPGGCHAGAGTLLLLRSARSGSPLARIHRLEPLSGFSDCWYWPSGAERFWVCRCSRLVRRFPVFRLVREEGERGSGRAGWCCSGAQLLPRVLPGPVGR